jgi:aminoglycoside 6'-N-acetyltransferase
VEPYFRRLGRGDFGLLARWFSCPHVEPWWKEPYDAASIEKRYGPSVDGSDPTELFIVEIGGSPIGFMQRYSIDDNPAWKASLSHTGDHDGAVGIDYLIGEEGLIAKGLGPQLIGAFVAAAWQRYPEAPEVVVTVQQANRRSWRALEKAGFERTWSGTLESEDPSDAGLNFVYVLRRSRN